MPWRLVIKAIDKKRLAVAVGVLGESFGREVTPITIRAYELGLDEIAIEEIEKAVSRAIAEKKFMPVPAELRELSGELLPQDRAIKAWAVFREARRIYGYYRSVNFDDSLINATVRNLGGWMRVDDEIDNMTIHEYETFFRKKFEQIYVSLYHSGIRMEDAQPLMGFCEMENLRLGFDPHDPDAFFRNDEARRITAKSMAIIEIKSGLPTLPQPDYIQAKVIPLEQTKLLEHIGKMPE